MQNLFYVDDVGVFFKTQITVNLITVFPCSYLYLFGCFFGYKTVIKANNAKLAGIELRENETKVHFAHFALLHYS